jgi:hypothetical protein
MQMHLAEAVGFRRHGLRLFVQVLGRYLERVAHEVVSAQLLPFHLRLLESHRIFNALLPMNNQVSSPGALRASFHQLSLLHGQSKFVPEGARELLGLPEFDLDVALSRWRGSQHFPAASGSVRS